MMKMVFKMSIWFPTMLQVILIKTTFQAGCTVGFSDDCWETLEEWISLGIFLLYIFCDGKFLLDVESKNTSRKNYFQSFYGL